MKMLNTTSESADVAVDAGLFKHAHPWCWSAVVRHLEELLRGDAPKPDTQRLAVLENVPWRVVDTLPLV